MLRLWIFWVEILIFSAYVVWSLLLGPSGRGRTEYQSANAVLYSLALVYGLFGFARFVRRRWAIGGSHGA